MIPPLIREKHGRCLYRDFDGLIARTARLCPVFQRILTKKTQSKSDSSSDPAPRLSVWHDVFFRFFLTASDRKAVAVHSTLKYNTFWRLFSKNGASGDTAFFKKHSNINGFRTPEQRNYLYSALLKPSISAAIARFIFR